MHWVGLEPITLAPVGRCTTKDLIAAVSLAGFGFCFCFSEFIELDGFAGTDPGFKTAACIDANKVEDPTPADLDPPRDFFLFAPQGLSRCFEGLKRTRGGMIFIIIFPV